MSAPVPFEGSAEWADGSLRVLGKARFPSAFCTATLEADALARRARAVQVHVAPGHVEELPIRRS